MVAGSLELLNRNRRVLWEQYDIPEVVTHCSAPSVRLSSNDAKAGKCAWCGCWGEEESARVEKMAGIERWSPISLPGKHNCSNRGITID